MGWVLVAVGMFAAGSAACDWAWFMEHPKVQLVVSVLGRGGARVFYGVLGAALVIVGVLLASGLMPQL